MALATLKVIVTAAAVLTAQGSAASTADPAEVKCRKGETTQVREITTPGASFKVQCVGDDGGRKSPQKPKICVDSKCAAQGQEEATLKAACPGGKAAASEANDLTVNCPQLPNTQATILFLCGEKLKENATDVCLELKVLPPPPQGPQICAEAGTTTTLKIQGDKGETQFGCPADGLNALNPRDPEKVFKEDCTAQEDLKDLKFTASKPYNTLAATKKPRTRKLCYVCRGTPETKSAADECRVFIEVSGGPRLLGRTALSLAIPFVLAVLPLT